MHRATLEVLETVGVRVHHDRALALLADAGCRIQDTNLVYMPNWLVEESIQSAPSRITIYDRKGQEAMRLEGDNVYFGMGTDLLRTWDIRSGQLRDACLQDVVDSAKIGDYCPEIDFIASHAHPQDVTTNLAYIASFKALLENSTKPIYSTAASCQDLAFIIEMAAAVAGSGQRLREKPFIMHYAEPISPLVHSSGALEKLFLCAEKGIPLNYAPALLMGATGPISLSGACVVANAEALSGLVIHQLRAKGAPMISGFSATPMDMVTGTTVYGSPDERLTHSACVDLYHYYGLPVWGEAGCSDAKCLDEQAAIESTAQILMAALDGCNLVHDVGYLGQGLIGSPASIVMCSEIISYVRRIMRGFDMSRERIAMDVIRKVGPGGNFLAEDQTLRLCREEHWRPKLIDRNNPEAWARKGGRRYTEVVTRKAIEILDTHQTEPLPDTLVQRLNEIYARAAKELTGKFFSA
jgi:trimethylamine--corrinoid protein Co-methyltransferase